MTDTNTSSDNVFLIVSYFLLTLIAIFLVFQLLYWVLIRIKNKKIKKDKNKTYQQLLNNKDFKNILVKKNHFVINFFNYNSKKQTLKLKKNDLEEKSAWNAYRNIIHFLLIKWKQENKKKSIGIKLIIISFYLTLILIGVCSILYYWFNNINKEIISIFSFIGLIALILTWVFWTMIFEKTRKEIVDELEKIDIDLTTKKIIKNIAAYKTLFPAAELFF